MRDRQKALYGGHVFNSEKLLFIALVSNENTQKAEKQKAFYGGRVLTSEKLVPLFQTQQARKKMKLDLIVVLCLSSMFT
jgi:hypothetical protein